MPRARGLEYQSPTGAREKKKMLNITYIHQDGHTSDYHTNHISAVISYMEKMPSIVAAHVWDPETGEILRTLVK